MTIRRRLEDLRHGLSLKVVLSLAFAAMALFGAVAVGGVLESLGPGTVGSMLVGDMQDLAREAAQAIERSLAQRKREIELTANAAEFRAAHRDHDAIRLLLRRVQEISPFYELVGFIGSDGRIEATSNGLAEGEDVTGRDFWRIGRQRAYVSDAHQAILLAKSLGASDQMPRFVDFAAPVFDGETFKGVVVAHLSTEWAGEVGNSIARQVLSCFPNGCVELTDGQGVRIFSVKGPGVVAPASGIGAQAATVQRDFGPDPLVATADVAPAGPDSALHWLVRIRAPRADQLAITATVRHWLWSGGLGSVLFAALAGWVFAGWITRPLEAVADGIVGMAGGRRPVPILSGLREIDDIGVALSLASADEHGPANKPPAT